VPNLIGYVLQPPEFGREFPFLTVAEWSGFWFWRAFPGQSIDSRDSDFELQIGFLWSTPFYALSVVAAIALLGWGVRAARRRTLAPGPPPMLVWLIASSLAIATIGFLPSLVSFGQTTRYLFDVSAGLAFAATLGLSLLVAWSRGHRLWRGAVAAAAGAMVAVTLVVNLALWVGGPYGISLRTNNGKLFDTLSRAIR
jgi:hypothetical protein